MVLGKDVERSSVWLGRAYVCDDVLCSAEKYRSCQSSALKLSYSRLSYCPMLAVAVLSKAVILISRRA